MTLDVRQLEQTAIEQTGFEDFGSSYYREGLERTVDSLNNEADLNEMGTMLHTATLGNALAQRLNVLATLAEHPEIEDEVIDGPVFILGLPRTGTTALSQLIAADPQFRSLRTWESQAPTPPPETATQHTDPRIKAAEDGIEMMNSMFPRFKAMYSSEATTATECQDLMGMSFRTVHFDGVTRVPSYLKWVLDCDMDEVYTFHRSVLKLLQWHCPPNLWHLKTPVHIFALPALSKAYPDAKFLWSHRDPAKVLGSVCSLIEYVRSWSSDENDPVELGDEMLETWGLGIERAMAFRREVGEDRFVDVSFSELQTDPLTTISKSYDQLGIEFSDASRQAVDAWASEHKAGHRGSHDYTLDHFGLTEERVRDRFADYLATYDASA